MSRMWNIIKKTSPLVIYASLVQIASLLPMIYLLVGAGASVIYTHRNLFSVLFELGAACLSRAEVYLASLFYRSSGNELFLLFGLLIIALIFGLVIKKLSTGSEKARKITGVVFAVWCVIDIVIRFLPLRVNTAQTMPFRIVGIVFRLVCLALCAMSLGWFNGKSEK